MDRTQTSGSPDLSRFARQAFERKFGVWAGIWLERFETDGSAMTIYYGYVSNSTSEPDIGQFFTQVPKDLKD